MTITRNALRLLLVASVGLAVVLGAPRRVPAFGPPQKLSAIELTTRGSSLRLGSLTSRFFMSPRLDGATQAWISDGTVAGTKRVLDVASETGDQAVPIAEVSGVVLFTASTDATGAELWLSDGTAQGTTSLDIRPGPPGSSPSSLATLDQIVIFTADDGASGREIWASDGTRSGTSLISDLNPGPASSNPIGFAVLGGRALFSASDGVSRTLWATDGTTSGTERLSTASDPSGRKWIGDQPPWRGLVLFVGNDGATGNEIWITDGTSQGTRQIADVRPGSAGSIVSSRNPFMGEIGGRVVFLADGDGDGANELWATDGTQAGTQRIRSGRFQTDYGEVGVSLNGRLVFLLRDVVANTGREPWVTDGTPAGTMLLKDVNPGIDSGHVQTIGVVGGRMLFAGNDGASGTELWATDGTPAGTQMVGDFNPGPQGLSPARLGVIHGRTLLSLVTAALGREPFVTDGTFGGTYLLKDINPGPGNSDPGILAEGQQQLLFSANDGAHGREPWATDGTDAGTALVADVQPGATGSFAPFFGAAVPFGARTIFVADDGTHGAEPWVTDGTPAGTMLLVDVDETVNSRFNVARSAGFGSKLLFTVGTPLVGEEPWVTDGTPEGTVFLGDLTPGPAGSSAQPVAASDDRMLFTAQNAPWLTDGTPAGTERIPGLTMEQGYEGVSLNGLLFFGARDDLHGAEPRVSDGTVAGTRLLKEIAPGDGSSLTANGWFSGLALADAVVFFASEETGGGIRLWRSNGTESGTTQIADLRSFGGEDGAGASFLGVADDVGFFLTFYQQATFLWRTDGTVDGTFPVVPLADGWLTFYGKDLSAVSDAGRIFFAVSTASSGDALWVTDGTSAGTRLLHSSLFILPAQAFGSRLLFLSAATSGGLDPWITDGTVTGTAPIAGLASTVPGRFAIPIGRLNGRALLAWDDGLHGTEPWVTDGTAAGTALVADLLPGAAGTEVVVSTVLQADRGPLAGAALFAADDAHGNELWVTFGAADSTRRLTDVNPGPGGSSIQPLRLVGDRFVFLASDGGPPTTRQQLWSIKVPSPGAYVAYKASASRVPANMVPADWNVALDDLQLVPSNDDPENFTVDKAVAFLAPGALGVTVGESRPAYLRYQLKGAMEGAGPSAPDGRFPKAVKHQRRRWEVNTAFGTIALESQKESALLVAARAGGSTVDTSTTRFKCYEVKALRLEREQTPGGKFRKGLQTFAADVLDDCASAPASFPGTPVEGRCLYDLTKPVELCSPVLETTVVPPRRTVATASPTLPASGEVLVCYAVRRARTITAPEAATLAGLVPGTLIAQPPHRRRTGLEVDPASFLPTPTRIDTRKEEMICVPAIAAEARMR